MIEKAEEEQIKTVDHWLNEVDYGDNLNYVPSDFALEFVSFMKLEGEVKEID